MKTHRAETVPLPRSLGSALAASDSLASLTQRLRESQQRLDAVAHVLPEALRRELRAGPLDDEGWSVLASNAAVAAKLRHLLPRISDELRSHAFRDLPIRVRLRVPS